jgi:predicted nucleotidyltransferase component of viral defense system
MTIPLSLRIRKESHRKIAAAQDLIVEELYKAFDKAVFHGGTAIWRCYGGKRFSEDLDFYLPKDNEAIAKLFKVLEQRGFRILKKKVSENSIYSELELDRTAVRLEATFQKKTGHLADYEAVDGTIKTVYSLTPEEFIEEKVNAYLKRFKIRDLYDIFFLIKLANNNIAIHLNKLIKAYKKPIDEQDLKTIILEGIAPSSQEMIEYIQRKWENANTLTK